MLDTDLMQTRAMMVVRVRDFDKCVFCGSQAKGVATLHNAPVSLYNSYSVCSAECAAQGSISQQEVSQAWIQFGIEQAWELLDLITEKELDNE